MHYTQRLRELREDHDQKQESIALELHITRQQYQLYESGKRKLPIDLLISRLYFRIYKWTPNKMEHKK